MVATEVLPAVVFQPIPTPNGTRIVGLRAAADGAAATVSLEDLLEKACRVVASWNRRHPSLAVDLVVDLSDRPLDTQRLDQAIRFALGRSGLGGERLTVSVAGMDDDPALAPVSAGQIGRLLLPRALRFAPSR